MPSLVPSHRLVRSDYELEGPWRAVDRRETPPPTERRDQVLPVWRRGFRVFHRAVDRMEARALELLQQPIALARLCAELDDGGSPEASAGLALALLGQWLADELLTTPASPVSPLH